MKKIILRGKRIILKPFILKDAKDFSMLGESSWRIGKINTIAKAKKWIKNSWIIDNYNFGVFLKEDNKLIGKIELCHMNWWNDKAGEICSFLEKNFRGKGYGSEMAEILVNYCFKKLKFRKIYADTNPDNKRAIKGLGKLGFKLEGRIREKNFVNGRWVDELDYGLLRREWKK